MIVSKDKLPNGFSYPLQTSAIVSALDEARISINCSLRYYAHKGWFSADFWPPNPKVQYERLYLTVGAVPSHEAQLRRDHMLRVVIPEFVAWARGIVSLPADSPVRREKQMFVGAYPPAEDLR